MHEKHSTPSINLRKEIAREYRLSKFENLQIDILCDLYLLTKGEIEDILIKEGEKLPAHERIRGHFS